MLRTVGMVLFRDVLRSVGLAKQSSVLDDMSPVDGPLGRQLQGGLEIAFLLLLDGVTLSDVLLDALQVRAVPFAELPDCLDYDLGQVIRPIYLERLRL